VSPLVSAGREDGSQSLVSKFEEETLTTVDVNADFLGTRSQVHPRKLTENPWTQFGEDIDGEAAGDESVVSVKLSSDGKRVLIVAVSNNGNGGRSGRVRVFDLTGSAPTQIGGDIDGEIDGEAGDLSGVSAAISKDGTRVAIAQDLIGVTGNRYGRARAFQFIGEAWIQLGDGDIGEGSSEAFGLSLSLSADGNRVAMAAPFNSNGNGGEDSFVRVFYYKEPNRKWTQIGDDIDDSGRTRDGVPGDSVSLSWDGNRVAIGAFSDDGTGSLLGLVRVFEFYVKVAGNVAEWLQIGEPIWGEFAGDGSGPSVALSSDGNRVAIGFSGHVRMFGFDVNAAAGNGWSQIGQDIDGESAGDRSGRSIALSSDGNRVAIGADENDGSGRGGHVRLFDLDVTVAVNVATWSQIGQDIDGEAAGDRSGYSVDLAVNGNRVAIGAIRNDGGVDSNSGHVRLFDYVVCSALYLYVHRTPSKHAVISFLASPASSLLF
jgi:hypothetical protein